MSKQLLFNNIASTPEPPKTNELIPNKWIDGVTGTILDNTHGLLLKIDLTPYSEDENIAVTYDYIKKYTACYLFYYREDSSYVERARISQVSTIDLKRKKFTNTTVYLGWYANPSYEVMGITNVKINGVLI